MLSNIMIFYLIQGSYYNTRIKSRGKKSKGGKDRSKNVCFLKLSTKCVLARVGDIKESIFVLVLLVD